MMSQPRQQYFHFTKEGTNKSGSFGDLLQFLKTCNKFVEDYAEYGMTELHPVLEVNDDTLVVELEFIEDSECKHDRQTCIDAYHSIFAPYFQWLN
jgi:hypothetical protein